MDRKDRENRIVRAGLPGSVKRVVVKVGSGVLTSKSGLNSRVIKNLTDDVKNRIHQPGGQVSKKAASVARQHV